MPNIVPQNIKPMINQRNFSLNIIGDELLLNFGAKSQR